MAKNNKVDKVEVASNTSNEASNSPKEASSSSKEDVYIVIHPFADKDNFSKMWEAGEDVSHFDRKRLESCIERGLVKKQG